jgi:hypothetical protein
MTCGGLGMGRGEEGKVLGWVANLRAKPAARHMGRTLREVMEIVSV